MRLVQWFAASVLIGFPGFSQDMPNPVTNGDFFDISGQVLDTVTAAPISRAQVTLQSQAANGGQRVIRSDNSGNFLFPHVKVGPYALLAEKNGYAQGEDAYRELVLVAGTQPTRYPLKLLPQAVVTGTVTGDDGEPRANAYVVVLRPEISRGRKRYREREKANTDERGIYRLSGLGPGPCLIAAITEPDQDEQEDGFTYVPTYYPNSSTVEGATVVQLAPGLQQTADIKLTLVDGHKIEGRAPAGSSVELLAPSGSVSPLAPRPRQAISPNGDFALDGAPTGDYILKAQSQDQNQHTYRAGFLPISVGDNDMSGLTLAFQPPPSLQGSIHVGGNGTVQDAVRSLGVESLFAGSHAALKNSRFQFEEPLPPYRYRFLADLGTNWYIQSAAQGPTDLLRNPVQIGPGAQPVDLTVNPKGASIVTTVQWPDSGPRPEALITVLQQNGDEMIVVAEQSVRPPHPPATDYPAVVNGLAPGDYVVYAWAQPVTIEYARADALDGYAALGQSVTVDEGLSGRVTVKVAGLP